jgi:hypothetical protein
MIGVKEEFSKVFEISVLKQIKTRRNMTAKVV